MPGGRLSPPFFRVKLGRFEERGAFLRPRATSRFTVSSGACTMSPLLNSDAGFFLLYSTFSALVPAQLSFRLFSFDVRVKRKSASAFPFSS